MNSRQQAGIVLAATFVYALIRYVLLHDVVWANVPLFILNKSVSWSGVIFFGMSLLSREKPARRYFGTLSVVAIAAHLLMSLMVLNPSYFAKFYGPDGQMNGVGELSMLAGVVGTLFLGGLFYLNLNGGAVSGSSLRTGWGRLVLWCAAFHVAIMGYNSWLAPMSWYGYLPPITLLSFLTSILILVLRQRRN